MRISSTPGRLALATAATVVALGLLFGAVTVLAASARDALRVIGHDAGQQVVATTDLYFALSDADAQVANLLLMGGPAGAEGSQAAADRYEQRRREIGTALLRAHQLAEDSPAEQRTIESILDGYGRYEQLAARALLLAEQAGYPAGAPGEPVLDAYRQATDLMSYQVLPQAYNLTLENGTTVRRTHDEARATIRTGQIVVILCGALALGCLAWLQIYLLRRFRRLLTPALALATVIAGVYAVAGLAVLSTEAQALSTAKQDGFDSVLALARARAVSNSLHADQVRFLLDRQRADTYEQIYLDKAQSLVYVEAGNLADYYVGVAALVEIDRPAAPGLLGDQVRGSGDESAAAAALAAFQQLQETDRELRAAAVAEPSAEAAVELRFGPLATAFDDYDAALVALTNQHRAVFETAVSGGEDALSRLGFWQPVAIVAIVLLLIAGLVPRFREYR